MKSKSFKNAIRLNNVYIALEHIMLYLSAILFLMYPITARTFPMSSLINEIIVNGNIILAFIASYAGMSIRSNRVVSTFQIVEDYYSDIGSHYDSTFAFIETNRKMLSSEKLAFALSLCRALFSGVCIIFIIVFYDKLLFKIIGIPISSIFLAYSIKGVIDHFNSIKKYKNWLMDVPNYLEYAKNLDSFERIDSIAGSTGKKESK